MRLSHVFLKKEGRDLCMKGGQSHFYTFANTEAGFQTSQTHLDWWADIYKVTSQYPRTGSSGQVRTEASAISPKPCTWPQRKRQDKFSSVAQSCPTLWDPMGCSTPGFPVPHQLPELAETHHWVDDTIQPSHPRQGSVVTEDGKNEEDPAQLSLEDHQPRGWSGAEPWPHKNHFRKSLQGNSKSCWQCCSEYKRWQVGGGRGLGELPLKSFRGVSDTYRSSVGGNPKSLPKWSNTVHSLKIGTLSFNWAGITLTS